MNMYLISQSTNNGYDTYDSAVVCAESEEEARNRSPADGSLITDWNEYSLLETWAASPAMVKVVYLGVLDNEQISPTLICSSFNAG